MERRLIAICARIIGTASRDMPADTVLRHVLRDERSLPELERRAISRAVFAFYRWFGWLDKEQPLGRQIRHATELANHYASDPGSFRDNDLIRRAVPAWLTSEMTVTAKWVRVLQREPTLWLRARSGEGTAVAAQLGDCQPAGAGRLADILKYVGEEDIFRTELFLTGKLEIQDISSQLVGLLCDPKAGEKWWDACAGEGGKTLHLSDLMANQGLIWASDRAPWRLKVLFRRAARAKVYNYRSAIWDGSVRLPTKTLFDGVLLDAPCSGVGTWQRNPHARWSMTRADVRELAQRQHELLTHSAAAVKPGGRLFYAVCSLTRAETDSVAESSDKRLDEFRRVPLRDPLSLSPADAARQLWYWPQTIDGNGMFVAAWQRKG